MVNLLMLARITIALFLLSACEDRDAECEGVDCTSPNVIDQWERDPDAARQAILATPDPVTQLAAVRALAMHHPEELAELCPGLSGATKRECTQMSQRPHLWKKPEALKSEGQKLGSLTSEAVASPPTAFAPVETDCADNSCRLTAASEAGAQGSGPGICASITETSWRNECFFRVGEQAADLALGVTVCLHAGPYVERCLGHISRNLATPPIALDSAAGWKTLQASVQRVTQALPAPLSQQMANRIWAESLTASYNASGAVTGDPLDHLPAAARPHILAAAAWRLSKTERHRGLDAWMSALDAALARRGATHNAQGRPGAITRGWLKSLPGEDALPWVAYLRDQRRAQGQSEEAERIICLLEAMLRSSTRDELLLEDASRHPDQAVRWTVARVTGRHAQLDPINTILQQDADPLVVQRASVRRTR